MRRLVTPAVTPTRLSRGAVLLALLALAGCGTVQQQGTRPAAPSGVKTPPRQDPSLPVLPPAGSGRGGYYKDDGPGDNPPPNLADVPDAEVRNDPPLPRANRPYTVLGKTYTPITDLQPFSQRGTGTWYGKKFHGQRTSSGELYDMYKMTAAHPTLPIPSYARITSIDSGKQVIVRINDRGPFHASRVIDVSYTAALKLGLLAKGSHEVLVERLLPDDIDRIVAARGQPQRQLTPSVQVVVPPPEPVPVLKSPPPPVADQPPATPQTGAVLQPETTLVPVAASSAGAPAAAAPAAAVAGGFYLQLGAYSQSNNADAARARLLPHAERLGSLDVVQSGGVYRVFGGPFASRADALQAAQGLPDGLSLRAIVIQR
ncbi:septal ring lytic transglycosylase RlpA family protein [Janthinobacterium agaricidamnosum]|uniref:Endolytic peptidoglycan transglycosylase RlpA n=1 Tax=Janthinobacterium agaricidamnosum NBRC 102515 = DSM 9628 TaxID=1349767 RepID=W0VC71_9BURK|nr:septal ring lytic transglycosylase RlpA family protein [Janthinobacterium agaricidamnosum]CDG85255.1 rare lipoA family protein [Janthinobacterium agaricidamnosum NBRC 102515 = DSM 9628]